jgi:RimJ/RimL family protein N-acetyltransferase
MTAQARQLEWHGPRRVPGARRHNWFATPVGYPEDLAVSVRAARVEDAERIAEIHVLGWQGGYRGLIPQEYLDGLDPAQRLPLRIQWLQGADWSRGGCFVVADDEGRLAGFADVGRSRDDDADSDRVGEVRAIYLAPDAWGKGLGRELMAAALTHLAKLAYGQVTLWVLDTNARARSFYEAAGFRPDGAVKVDDSLGFSLREVRYRRTLA